MARAGGVALALCSLALAATRPAHADPMGHLARAAHGVRLAAAAAPLTVRRFGGAGPPTLVLLHGYGSSADRFEPFTHTIRWPLPARFVFPEAPEVTVPPDGPSDGRAWWHLDLYAYVRPGKLPDLSRARPPGLPAAAARVTSTLADIARAPGGPVVLGGFSQGAMVASEIAFASTTPMAALVILSGTPVGEARWQAGLARRRGLPVFISHGRRDDVLPFASADRLRRKLQAAGLRVTWLPFDGGHEIPAEVVGGLNRFLDGLGLGAAAGGR